MRIFATAGDYIDYAHEDPPENIDRLLLLASGWVRDVTKRARFATTKDGEPKDEGIKAALRDATCEQVLVWVQNGVEPGKQPDKGAVSATSIGDASISYETDSVVAQRALAASSLAPTALTILAAEGLAEGQPWVR